VGIVLVSWGFVAGIDSALSGMGGSNVLFVGLFVLGAIVVIGTVIASVLGLAVAGHRVLWAIALLLGILPIIAVIVIATVSRTTT
jgi:hypothetical protein